MGQFFEDDKSLYRYDMRARSIISDYTDRYFYPCLLGPHEAIFRTEGKAEKEKGVNLVIRDWWNRKDINICEKASSHYINSALSNFAFEIGSGRHPGWFVREDNQTDYYSIIWVRADRNRYPITRFSNTYFVSFQEVDIEYMIACFLHKKTIMHYLEKRGFYRQDLLDKAEEMVRNGQERDLSYKEQYGFWFVFSKALYEKPVNVIFSKELLCELSKDRNGPRCYRFSKAGIQRINSLG